MEVFLVNISGKTNQIQFPLGLPVLVNSLKLQNIEPKVIDLIPLPIDERISALEKNVSEKPAIYGFSIMIGGRHLDITEKVVKTIREKSPNSIIVYGGSLVSSIPDLILKNCSCDYLIHGEGEVSFPALIRVIRQGVKYPEDILGVYYKKSGHIFGEPNKRIRKLDKLSNPDFSLFDMPFYIDYLKQMGQSWEIMASRGCAGNCSFCYKFMGNGLSMRNIDDVLDEIEYIIDNFDIRRFYFVDENFLQSKKYFRQFITRKIERRLDFEFIGQARIDSIDAEKCQLGSANGLICISTGIESASQNTLDRINKRITIEDAEEKLSLMIKYDIRPTVNFIIGFPWETEQDYIELLDFIKRNELKQVSKLSYLTPLPATDIYNLAVQKGLIEDEFEYIRNLDNLYWQRQINLTQMPDDLLDHYFDLITNIGQRQVTQVKSLYADQIRELH